MRSDKCLDCLDLASPKACAEHTPSTVEDAVRDLDTRLQAYTQAIGTIKRYLAMAGESRARGDHRAAKSHLKRALDLEFSISYEVETAGDLATVWYPSEEL